MRIVVAGGERLPCVVRGVGGAVKLLVVPALFEEMNRTRRLVARTTAALAAAGVESWLPDLPGTGDHEDAPETADWERWRGALAMLAAVVGADHVLALRGGALLADAAPARAYHLVAPVARGERLLRELLRARALVDDGRPVTVPELEAALARGETIEAAGYAISPALAAALRAAELAPFIAPVRRVSLTDDPAAHARLDGPPLWRQSEPEVAPALAAALAADVLDWLRCPADRC